MARRGAEQDAGGARVGAVPDAEGIDARVVEHDAEHGRAGRQREHGHQHEAHATAEQAEQPDEHQRPDQVELLLDRQRPQVQQRRRPTDRREVRLLDGDEVPVGDVRGRGQHRAAQTRPPRSGARSATRADTTTSSVNSAGSSRRARRAQNALKSVRAGAHALAQQQRGDEVPADDEEDLDAEEATRHPRRRPVVGQHGQHRHRPEPVERRAGSAPTPASPCAGEVSTGAVVGPIQAVDRISREGRRSGRACAARSRWRWCRSPSWYGVTPHGWRSRRATILATLRPSKVEGKTCVTSQPSTTRSRVGQRVATGWTGALQPPGERLGMGA